MIEEIDWSVSQILAAIERLSINDNTYVVFTSDNGPWLAYGAHAGSAKPLKDGKGTTFEGGMRVMTFLVGPELCPDSTMILACRLIYYQHLSHWPDLQSPTRPQIALT